MFTAPACITLTLTRLAYPNPNPACMCSCAWRARKACTALQVVKRTLPHSPAPMDCNTANPCCPPYEENSLLRLMARGAAYVALHFEYRAAPFSARWRT